MQVSDAVLPQLIRTSSGQRSRASCVQKLSAELQPKKIETIASTCARRRQSARPVAHRNANPQLPVFLSEGLKELLEEITPITDFSGKKMELRILATPSIRQSTILNVPRRNLSLKLP